MVSSIAGAGNKVKADPPVGEGPQQFTVRQITAGYLISFMQFNCATIF
jgi:hypothetical protein